eukprot:GFYU01004124.1.p1 GENE.GFYU01004124.1~~GFYU01004124.1.p1  ORF type:complete len:160 (+),score=19.46 GFYU01004124.1:130-609(+)
MSLLHTLDSTLSATVIGITVWFFFIQGPFLVQVLGREKFIPIMMKTTKVYFNWVPLFASLTAVLAFVHSEVASTSFQAAVAAALFGWFGSCVIVPRALSAAARSLSSSDRHADDQAGRLSDIAKDGGGSEGTRLWHQAVVLFVVGMNGSMLLHLVQLYL